MSTVNRAIVVGNVGRDPDISGGRDGKKIAAFSLATSERWKDESGAQQERTDWHRVVCFNDGLSGVIEQYVKKGSKVYVEGSMQTRKYTDKEGVDRYVTEIVLNKFRSTLLLLDRQEGDRAPKPTESQYGAKPDFDDEIPF